MTNYYRKPKFLPMQNYYSSLRNKTTLNFEVRQEQLLASIFRQ